LLVERQLLVDHLPADRAAVLARAELVPDPRRIGAEAPERAGLLAAVSVQ
jgi:hypothetical protein